MIKDTMDKKFGPTWHVIVGKGFSYEITYEVQQLISEKQCVLAVAQIKHILNILVGGTTAVLLWKL